MVTYTSFQAVDTIICWCVQLKTSDLGHSCLQEWLTEITQKTFASPSKNSDRKEGEEEEKT